MPGGLWINDNRWLRPQFTTAIYNRNLQPEFTTAILILIGQDSSYARPEFGTQEGVLFIVCGVGSE